MKKILTDNELIEIVDKIHNSYPGKKIKQTDLVEELAKRGITIDRSTISKNNVVKEHIKRVNSETISLNDVTEIVFNPLNLHSLANMSKKQILDILAQREAYYSECANKASLAKKTAEELQKQLNDALSDIEGPKDAEIKALKEEVTKLRSVINKHILPETANDLLGIEMRNRKTCSTNGVITGDDVISEVVDTNTGEILNEEKYDNDVLNIFKV